MKTKLIFSLLLSFVFCLLSSQVPLGFNYQAIARDGSGIALANQALPVKIAIQTSLTGGTLIYEELFSSVTSNQFGLISLVVGTGTQTGGSAASFSAIDWKAQTLFLKTIIQYPGTTWTTMGTSQIWGVPYSLVAKEVAGPLSKLGITGTTDVMDEALFEVKNKAGNTVFAVYNEGIRAYVGNGKAKGIKGGFSVGGYDATKGSTIYDLFTLSTDSARLYFDSKPAGKGIKGGFSIGGYDMTKGGIPVQNYLTVNKDSVRIYIDSNPATKGIKGGFSVGGYDMTKGGTAVSNYLNVETNASGIINPAQNRILWYPLKNAFLAGKVRIGTPDSVGENSFATGYQPKARGMYSQAMGFKAIANGDYSTSIGKNAIASSTNSFALGDSPQATGLDSYAFGAGAIASGPGSYAFGSDGRDKNGNLTGAKTTASGSYSFAIGQGSVASNTSAFASGLLATASGKGSTAIGFGTVAQGEYSTAMGAFTKSYGTASTSMGAFTVANSDVSTAMGMLTSATGYGSTALGYSSVTNAESATAMGYGTNASGIGSTAMGLSTAASGTGSTSMGSSTAASGYFSTALGFNTTAQCYASLVLGRYNLNAGLSDEWNFWDPVFVIGNGSSTDARSNAMTVYKNGIADFGWFINLNKTSTGEALRVSDAQAIWYDGTYFSWGYGGTYNVFADKVSIGTVANPGSYSLYVSGNAYSTGSWSGSDIRWKKNLEPLQNVLPELLNLRGVRYNWRTDEYSEMNFEKGVQIGLVAQEVEKVFPDLVRTDDKGYKAVSYDKLSVILLEGIKEQQKQIESQQERIDRLEKIVSEIEAKLENSSVIK
jgi:hypothetical protein